MLLKLKKFTRKNRYTLATVATSLLILALLQIHLISTRGEQTKPLRIALKGFKNQASQLSPIKGATLQPASTQRKEDILPPNPIAEEETKPTPEDFGLIGRRLPPANFTRLPGGLVLTFNISKSELNPEFDPKLFEPAFRLSDDQTLYLSLESLDPQETKQQPLRAEISRERSYYRGYYASLTLPPSDKKQRHFGIFICSDTSKTGRCAGKPIIDLKDPASAASKPGVNRVYFFNYLLVEGNRAYALDYGLGDKMYYRLRDYLRETADPSQKSAYSNLETIVKRVIAYSFDLRESSLKIKGPTIRIAFRKGR